MCFALYERTSVYAELHNIPIFVIAMRHIIQIAVLMLLLPLAIADDDYIIGEYEHVDKLTIKYDTWSAHISGEGKYVAGFIETFYDNISENYRKNPVLRAKVLEQMEKAKAAGKQGFNLYQDDHWLAFKDTVGKAGDFP